MSELKQQDWDALHTLLLEAPYMTAAAVIKQVAAMLEAAKALGYVEGYNKGYNQCLDNTDSYWRAK